LVLILSCNIIGIGLVGLILILSYNIIGVGLVGLILILSYSITFVFTGTTGVWILFVPGVCCRDHIRLSRESILDSPL